MSHSIHVLWFDLFHQKKADLLHHIPPTFLEDIPSTYTVDSSLRISFENFCREIREREYPRLLARLRYDRVDVFARTIDRALQYKPPINFAGLISAALFITIQCGYQARVVLSDVIDLLNKLDRAVPSLGDDVSPDAPQVHECLRNIFQEYMDCLVHINYIFLGESSTDLISEVQNRIREAKAALKQGRKALECDFSQSYTPEHQREQSLFSDSTGTWRLDRQELLGRGAFGEVYKVVERSTGQVYALKQIPLGSDPERQRVIEEKVQNECKTMRKLPHLHIINVSFFYPEVECWNIIMDVVADSNLRQFLHYCCSGEYRDPETFSVMLPWFGCLVDALNFAHRCKVIHNDIKPSNILIKGDTVYLADFGLSSDFTAQDSSRGLEYIQYGTPEYKAPEMSLGAHPSRMADVFSLGCIFSEMLTVRSQRSLDSFRRYRSRPNATRPESYFRNSLPSIRAWLQQLKDTNDRQLFALFYQTLDMIEEDPDRRPSAEAVRDDLLGSRYRASFFCPMHL